MHIITRKRLNDFAEKHPDAKSEVLYVPHTEKEYQETVTLLDSLIDQVGEDETHPLASLMEILGVLIEKYEDDHIPEVTDF